MSLACRGHGLRNPSTSVTATASTPTSSEPEYWPQVSGELTFTLDDILLEDGRVAPFSRSEAAYVAMGRAHQR